jgi:hypothetical protein
MSDTAQYFKFLKQNCTSVERLCFKKLERILLLYLYVLSDSASRLLLGIQERN